MNPIEEPRQVIGNLSTSVWAFATLACAVESGLLGQLTEPRSLTDLSAITGIDSALAERVLDVLVSLGLVRREGDVFASAPGLLPLLGTPAMDDFLAELRTTYLQSWQVIQSARQGGLALGWQHTDPEILQSQGRSGRGLTQMLAQQVFPSLDGLEERLRAPTAAFLDVGTGVGIIAIELCRLYPKLHAVGLEPQAAPLAEARRNVAAANLERRIELRAPTRRGSDGSRGLRPGLPAECVHAPRGVPPWPADGLRALRPGGWVSLVAISAPGPELDAALSRLRNVLWGGNVQFPEQVAEMAREAGYVDIKVGGAPGSMTKGIMARRPA